MFALVGDSKAPGFSNAGYAPADASAVIRTAKLELSREGSLAAMCRKPTPDTKRTIPP